MAEKRFFVRSRGKVLGPFDLEQLKALRNRGQLRRFHEVSQDRQSWVPAASLTELFHGDGAGEETAVLAHGPADAAGARPGSGGTPGPVPEWFYVDAQGQQQGPVSP